MSAERSLVERLAAWASRIRADGVAWDRTAVRDDGTAANALPLTEVRHTPEDTPESIARAIAGAIADVVDPGEKGRTVRVYPLGTDGAPLRQGYTVRVDAETLRPVLATASHDVARMPEEQRSALIRDTAYAGIIGRMGAHSDALHAHLVASLEHTHAMVQTVVGTVNTTQTFAQNAIAAASARAAAAEAREAELSRRLDDVTAERDRATARLEEVLAMLKDTHDSEERRERLMELIAPVLHGAGVRVGQWVREGNDAPKRPPINGQEKPA